MMCPLLYVPNEIIFILLTASILNVCLIVYGTISAFVYRVRISKSIFCVFLTTLSWIMYAYISRISKFIYNRITIFSIEKSIAKKPVVIMVIILFVLTACSILVVTSIHRWRLTNLSANSVKESCDSLPDGLCYYDNSGLVCLKNSSMENLCLELCGLYLLDGNGFWNEIIKQAVYISENNATVDLGKNEIWSFHKTQIDSSRGLINQLTATNISQYFELTKQLNDDIDNLKTVNAHLKKYCEMVAETTRDEEILKAKERIHREMGRTLITTRRYIENNKVDDNKQELLKLWKNNILVLKYSEDDEPDVSFMRDIENAASLVGIKLNIAGEIPMDNKPVMQTLTFAILECLNNSARHANATKLNVECLSDNNNYIFRFFDNGKAKSNTISEGGGISSLRKRVEKLSGSLDVTAKPKFTLSICIPKITDENPEEEEYNV